MNDPNYNLTQKVAELEARLKPIREVYERYQAHDFLLTTEESVILRNLWAAVKKACEK
jgi:hypothetical protein